MIPVLTAAPHEGCEVEGFLVPQALSSALPSELKGSDVDPGCSKNNNEDYQLSNHIGMQKGVGKRLKGNKSKHSFFMLHCETYHGTWSRMVRPRTPAQTLL